MPFSVNLRHLEDESKVLEGELSPAELDLEEVDELIHVRQPLTYEVEAQKLEHNLLLRGRLALTLDCECARCLVPFQQEIRLEDWVCHVPLQGDEAAPVESDSVDLTPYVREDILLDFPRHPLCRNDCEGLLERRAHETEKAGSAGAGYETSPDWSELNKLKF